MENSRETIYCIGDSHASFFSGSDAIQPIYPEAGRNLIPLFRAFRLGPVLAYSLPKLETRSRGREKLFELLQKIPAGSRVLLIFGEIDCRVHLLKQAQARNESLEKVVQECVDRYLSVAREVRDKGFRVMLFAAIPSLLHNTVVEPEFIAYGTCVERNQVTKIFNDHLKAAAGDIPVISVFEELVDADGLTRTEYLSDGVHLSQKVMPLVIQKIAAEMSGSLPLLNFELLDRIDRAIGHKIFRAVSYARAYIQQAVRGKNKFKVKLFPYYKTIREPVRTLRSLIIWQRAGRPVPPPHVYKQLVIKYYARRYGLKNFVETGTFMGDMVEAVKHIFKKIYSLELSGELYEKAKERFKEDAKVEILNGDSGVLMLEVVKKIGAPTLYWLDGHYSGDGTARGNEDTPVMKELEAILVSRNGGVILIDDARLFNGTDGYPTMSGLSDYLKQVGAIFNLLVKDDIIRIVLK